MKLSVSFRLLDLGQSAGLLGRVISSSTPGDCVDGEFGGMEWFWQGKPKYSEKTCSYASLSTTNPTCQTRARTRAAATNRFSYGAAQVEHLLLIILRYGMCVLLTFWGWAVFSCTCHVAVVCMRVNSAEHNRSMSLTFWYLLSHMANCLCCYVVIVHTKINFYRRLLLL
jgi:hypothetical protein